MKYAQLVVGPAGCGKSTYCHVIQEHCYAIKRMCRVINLDPAAEQFKYDCYLDIRELVKVEEVMEYFSYGPNGALLFAMEYLLKKNEWMEDNFDSFGDDDFILIDCPGQIELYTHDPTFRDFIRKLESWDYRCVSVYCLDVSFISDHSKFISGALAGLSSMILLETPHINVLTKADLLSEKEKHKLERLLDRSPSELDQDFANGVPEKYRRLNQALMDLLEEWSLVSFTVLDINDDESVEKTLLLADNAIQYGENLEPQIPRDEEPVDD